jgi:putative DNA modification/repair radical SAM protein
MAEDYIKKLKILAQGARFDASCASNLGGGLTYKERDRGISRYIYHSWTESGRCIPILKVLLTNYCIYDCAYCQNRRSNDIERATFTPEELAGITYKLYSKKRIEGLFLSSAIIKDSNYTMELMLRTIRLLREEYGFCGYIHTKILPHSDISLIEKIGLLSNRISINIELPSEESLRLLAPEKNREAILRPMINISELITNYRYEGAKFKSVPKFSPSGQSTQIIIGATGDTDFRTLNLSFFLYRKLRLARVYYSAYTPVNQDTRLPNISNPPLKREHRLYQADWLIRDYGFSPEELLDEPSKNLSLDLDPKTEWALRNLQEFPIEINNATYEELIRVPGIGKKNAARIIRFRKNHAIGIEDLNRLSIPLKRTRHFITVKGKYLGDKLDSESIRRKILGQKRDYEQQSFEFFKDEITEEIIASNTGEF